MSWLRDQKYTHKIVISGNHDMIFDNDEFTREMKDRLLFYTQNKSEKAYIEKPDTIKDLLKSIPNCHYLEHEGLELLGYKFFGTPYILPLPPGARDCTAFIRND